MYAGGHDARRHLAHTHHHDLPHSPCRYGKQVSEAGGAPAQAPAIVAAAAPVVVVHNKKMVHYKKMQRIRSPFATVNAMTHTVSTGSQPGNFANKAIEVYNYLTLELPREYKHERIVRSMVCDGDVHGIMFDMGEHNCFIVAKIVFYDSYDKASGIRCVLASPFPFRTTIVDHTSTRTLTRIRHRGYYLQSVFRTTSHHRLGV